MTKLEEIEKVKKEADKLMMNKLAEIEELKNKIASLEDSLRSKDYWRDPDYQFLVDENHRLEQQYLEVKADNVKMARQVDDQINKLREAGLL
jgi:two-component SAPR family response regulator